MRCFDVELGEFEMSQEQIFNLIRESSTPVTLDDIQKRYPDLGHKSIYRSLSVLRKKKEIFSEIQIIEKTKYYRDRGGVIHKLKVRRYWI